MTSGAYGHTLNRRQIFSPDGDQIFYDTRNLETEIGVTRRIESVDVNSGEIELVYEVKKATEFGPGVGAVACHPRRHHLVFIHGLTDCSERKPYASTRRLGALIELDGQRSQLEFAEARCVERATWGALRGGTHAHSWSSNGDYLSFTYNDAWIEEHSATIGITDRRTVGVMFTQMPAPEFEDKISHVAGKYWSGIAAPVVDRAVNGSDEIEQACEECFVGSQGYRRRDGLWQQLAIAFQGRTRDEKGELVNEVFIADIPGMVSHELSESPIDKHSRLKIIPETKVRRLTNTCTRTHPGIQGPRNWLTSSTDGNWIYFLMKDDQGIVQLFAASTQATEIRQVTNLSASIQDQVSISHDGLLASFVANDQIFLVRLETGESQQLQLIDSNRDLMSEVSPPVGAVHFAPYRSVLAFNRYVTTEAGKCLQVFLAEPAT